MFIGLGAFELNEVFVKVKKWFINTTIKLITKAKSLIQFVMFTFEGFDSEKLI